MLKDIANKTSIVLALSIFIICISISILLIVLYCIGFFTSIFELTAGAGGWLYEYQILITGVCAIIASLIAYKGVVKKLSWNESQKEKETKKVFEDLLADSSEVMFRLVFIDVFINKNLVKEANEIFIENSLPLSLGYKFFDDKSIERLESMQRVHVRSMVKSIEDFNNAFIEKDYKTSGEAKDSFLLSYELLFSKKLEGMYSLARSMASLIKKNQSQSKGLSSPKGR